MIIYVTSNCCSPALVDGKKVSCAINNANGILDSLKADLQKQDNFVFVTSTYNQEATLKRFENVCNSLALSGLNFKNCICIGKNTKKLAKTAIKTADLIFLSGGLVPEQNNFFNEIKLKELLQDFNGVIIGQSAGAMNLAKDVYNYPENTEELDDPMFVNGLGLTNISVIPHFNKDTGNDQVDPSIDLWNILNNYSKKTTLVCLPNNSHIVVKDKLATVHGLAYTLTNANLTQICENGKSVVYTAGNQTVEKNCIYKHYAGDLYLVEDIALNTETEEDMVVYRALYGSCKLFARPLNMFASKLSSADAEKYGQEYRFTKVDIDTKNKKWSKR